MKHNFDFLYTLGKLVKGNIPLEIRINDVSFHVFSVEVVEDGQGYPCVVRHSDPGIAAGRKPGSSLLPLILHLCRPWRRAVWQIR